MRRHSSFQLKPIDSSGPKVVYYAGTYVYMPASPSSSTPTTVDLNIFILCFNIACVLNDALYVHGGLPNKNDKMPTNQLFKFYFESL